MGRVENGYVYLDARREDLIISGGVNVYPAEVEHVLRSVPGVQDAAVVGVTDARWGQQVCAVIVGNTAETTIRARIAERLVPAKRPKNYMFLSELPHTATGKVQRTKLRDLF